MVSIGPSRMGGGGVAVGRADDKVGQVVDRPGAALHTAVAYGEGMVSRDHAGAVSCPRSRRAIPAAARRLARIGLRHAHLGRSAHAEWQGRALLPNPDA